MVIATALLSMAIAAFPLWLWLGAKLGFFWLSVPQRDALVDVLVFGVAGIVGVCLVQGRWAKAFILSAWVSMLISYQKPWIMDAVVGYMAVTFGLVFMFKLAKYLTDKQHITVIKLILGAALINAIWAVAQIFLGNNDPIMSIAERAHGTIFYTGFFDNPGQNGSLMALALPLVFVARSLSWRLGLIGLFGLVLFLSRSTMPLLAAIAGVGFYLFTTEWLSSGWLRRTMVFYISLVLLIAVLFFLFVDKPSMWGISLKRQILARGLYLSLSKPVVGHGMGSFACEFSGIGLPGCKAKAPDIMDPPGRPEHMFNEYGQTLFERGFFGFVTLVGLIVVVFHNGIKNMIGAAGAGGEFNTYAVALSGLVALGVNSFGFFVWHVPLLAFSGLMLGAILIDNRCWKRKEGLSPRCPAEHGEHSKKAL